jgi:putative transposase
MLTHKRKLILTKSQESRINSWIWVCRMVYNMGLEIRKEAWKNKQQSVSVFELLRQIKSIRDVEWVKDAPANSLHCSIKKLDTAYKNFFRSHKSGTGFPRFKSKRNYNSITFRQDSGVLRAINNTVNIPKIGKIKIFKDSEITGNIKTATIKKEPTGYFVYIVTDSVRNISNQDESQVIGLDMGLASFCIDSSGSFIANPKHFAKYERQLRIENRSLSRKKRYSNRWKKQAQRVALLHHKIANVRRDFLHKESTKIAKNYHTVYLEDLNIKGMVKNQNLSKHILDSGWGMFREMLEYKTNVVKVNPKFTSQTCNDCGAKDSKSRRSQSEFVCTSCGTVSHADINAAKNILSKGIAINRKSEPVGCALVGKHVYVHVGREER